VDEISVREKASSGGAGEEEETSEGITSLVFCVAKVGEESQQGNSRQRRGEKKAERGPHAAARPKHGRVSERGDKGAS